MNAIKESLEANKAAILESLPKEFHADFETQMNQAQAEPAPLAGDSLITAIKSELAANPRVDEKAAAAELTNIQAPNS